mmetsp:Transcript_61142/g.139865  ORF Transcript_61142/g.139865 Transcript_61142/m.139865 type:complete len:208 (-) Transcript_61142:177-800(-)
MWTGRRARRRLRNRSASHGHSTRLPLSLLLLALTPSRPTTASSMTRSRTWRSRRNAKRWTIARPPSSTHSSHGWSDSQSFSKQRHPPRRFQACPSTGSSPTARRRSRSSRARGRCCSSGAWPRTRRWTSSNATPKSSAPSIAATGGRARRGLSCRSCSSSGRRRGRSRRRSPRSGSLSASSWAGATGQLTTEMSFSSSIRGSILSSS